MAVFSTNQNRQLYVVTSVTPSNPSTLGHIQVGDSENKALKTSDGKIFFKYYGHGGQVRTDLIDVNSIVYAKWTSATDLARKLKQATISLDTEVNEGKPIVGQDYIVRIYINNYVSPNNTIVKYGAVHATSAMATDPEKFYTALIDSLTKNFSKEITPLFTFEFTKGDGETSFDGVTITEVEQPGAIGSQSSDPVMFEVIPTTVLLEGEEVSWAVVDSKTGKVAITDSDTIIKNGKKIADLEYFCMGERGDQYRNQGWPNVIPTKYLVDPTIGYDVVDIHYSFSDTGVNSQKSEKDITLVVPSDTSASTDLKHRLGTILNSVGVTIQE